MINVKIRKITQYCVELEDEDGTHLDFMGSPGYWMRLYGESWEAEYESKYTKYLDTLFSEQN